MMAPIPTCKLVWSTINRLATRINVYGECFSYAKRLNYALHAFGKGFLRKKFRFMIIRYEEPLQLL
jgi:hypothetical protein